jgi:uncharacterized membrane protein
MAMSERAATFDTRALLAAGMLIGAGMGGFVDGIVLHQILQWHNMISSRLPPSNLIDAKVNMFWDGLFHAAVWLMTAAGLGCLWRARAQMQTLFAGPIFMGGLLLGWGLFNTVEGAINHLWLGLHHVNETVLNPLPYDWAFQASGLLLMLAGAACVKRAKRAQRA